MTYKLKKLFRAEQGLFLRNEIHKKNEYILRNFSALRAQPLSEYHLMETFGGRFAEILRFSNWKIDFGIDFSIEKCTRRAKNEK